MAETKVIMPQMGESIFEGTITKWLKKKGDRVERDEPLFEISTDKIDSEIPAPASGVVQDILVKEGQTVQINTVVAVIGDGSSKPAERRPEVEAPDVKTSSTEGKPGIKEGPAPSPALFPAPEPEEAGRRTRRGRARWHADVAAGSPNCKGTRHRSVRAGGQRHRNQRPHHQSATFLSYIEQGGSQQKGPRRIATGKAFSTRCGGGRR